MHPRRRPSFAPFVDFVELVYVAPRWEVGLHHIDQPAFDLTRQPVPDTHDEGKIRVRRGKCGQGVGNCSLIRRFPFVSKGLAFSRIQSSVIAVNLAEN
jgi:hypothetical protein